MKKFYLLTKTLLVATLLLVGASNVWAETTTTYDLTLPGKNSKALKYNSGSVSCGAETHNYDFAIVDDIEDVITFGGVLASYTSDLVAHASKGIYSNSSRYFAVRNLIPGAKVSFTYTSADSNAATMTYYTRTANGTANIGRTAPVVGASNIASGDVVTIITGTYLVVKPSKNARISSMTITLPANQTEADANMAAAGNTTFSISTAPVGTGTVGSVYGITATWGGTAEETWTKTTISDTDRGWINSTAATVTDNVPTAGTYMKFVPTETGKLTVSAYLFAGSNSHAYLSDGTTVEDKSYPKSDYSNGTRSIAFDKILWAGKEYYVYFAKHSSSGVEGNKDGFWGFTYVPLTEVELAIADCKRYDTSAAFATAIDAESFASAEEVYAFNTTYHITNGVLTDGVRDITGVIRNAAITSTTDWADSRVITLNEQYIGAPDNIFVDANGQNLTTTQTVYGVPAGTYIVKVATRAASGITGNAWVYDGTQTIRANFTGVHNTGGTLGNGWSWSEVVISFYETKNLELGFYVGASTGWGGCDDWHMYKVESVPVALGANGYATFASTYPLDLTTSAQSDGSFTAYKAEVDNANSKVNFTAFNQWVPANTGILVGGAASTTVNIPVVGGSSAVSDNEFLVNEGGSTFEAASGYTYFGMIKNSDPLTFGTFAPGSVAIPADKAYLMVAEGGSARQMVAYFGEDLTGISEAKSEVEFAKEGKFVVDGKLVIFKNGMKFNANGQLVK